MSKFISNSTSIPNAFIDEAMSKVSDKALRVYLSIIRKTTGWQKHSDSISASQLMGLTGYSDERTIRSAAKELEKVGLIVTRKQTGKPTIFSPVRDTDFDIEPPACHVPPAQDVPPACDDGRPPACHVPDPLHDMHPTKETNTKERERKNTRTQKTPKFDFSVLAISEELAKEVIDYRKQIKKDPLTQRALKALCYKVDLISQKYSTTHEDVIGLMQEKGWKSIDPNWDLSSLSSTGQQAPSQPNSQPFTYEEMMRAGS